MNSTLTTNNKAMNENKLKIRGTSFKRYNENGIMRHSIELYLDGEIPALGLGLKGIAKLARKSARNKYYKP